MNNLIEINSAVTTNIGLVRTNNEDNFYFNGKYMNENDCGNLQLSDNSRQHSFVFAVCDGMGGESSGEKASLAAVTELMRYQPGEDTEQIQEIINNLNIYVEKTNDLIYQLSSSSQDAGRMGTTFAGLVICGNQAVAMNLGDSRIYLLKDGLLRQLTVDHTEAERLVRLGVITKEQSRDNKGRYMLTRHFGVSQSEGRMEADISGIIDVRSGDKFLVCSDGLTDSLQDERIKDLMTAEGKADEISEALVEEALKSGGNDNITALVVCIESSDMPSVESQESSGEEKEDIVVPPLRRKRRKKKVRGKLLIALITIVLAVSIILFITRQGG